MTADRELLEEALALTSQDQSAPRTAVMADVLMEQYIAEFVAESESLEGYDSIASDVLNAARDLVAV